MPTILRRLILWTIICSVSAAPSFILAHVRFNRIAMLVGVALFIAAYTICTSTETFDRFHRRPFVRRTLYIGYGLRLFISMLCPIGFGFQSESMLFTVPDVWPGVLSLQVVERMGLEPETFAGTLATTIVQGSLLNVAIFLIMLIVYWAQRLFMSPPPQQAPQGFDVILPARNGA
jgi:hypothetical protein